MQIKYPLPLSENKTPFNSVIFRFLLYFTLTTLNTVYTNADIFIGKVIGEKAFIEVIGSKQLASRAGVKLKEISQLFNPLLANEGVFKLQFGENRAVKVDPLITDLLIKAIEVCRWSRNILSPFGGHLYNIYGLYSKVPAFPEPEIIDNATKLANCNSGVVTPDGQHIFLGKGVKVDFTGFIRGFLVDKVSEFIIKEGGTNFSVIIGPVQRSHGAGYSGLGWEVLIKYPKFLEYPLADIVLLNESLSVISEETEDKRLNIGSLSLPPFIDHRDGSIKLPVKAVLTVTTSALEAEAIGYSLFIAGPRLGHFLWGNLSVKPYIMWVIGEKDQFVYKSALWSRVKVKERE